jgi:ankyrin repeat protein
MPVTTDEPRSTPARWEWCVDVSQCAVGGRPRRPCKCVPMQVCASCVCYRGLLHSNTKNKQKVGALVTHLTCLFLRCVDAPVSLPLCLSVVSFAFCYRLLPLSDKEELAQVIKNKPNMQLQDPIAGARNGRRTPLDIAVRKGHDEVVRELLAAGCDKDNADAFVDTPLYAAAAMGHEGVVRELLAAGCDKDKANSDGATPLCIAAGKGHAGVVWELLATGCEKNKAGNGGRTPLHIAALDSHEEVVRQLLAAGCKKDTADSDGATPLYLAARKGNEGVVRELLAAGCDKDKACGYSGNTPLCVAAQEGHVEVVRELLAAGCDKDKAGNGERTPLHIAVQMGHAKVVRELLASWCDTSGVGAAFAARLVWGQGGRRRSKILADLNLKVLFREHFKHLFLAFSMAHTLGVRGMSSRARAGHIEGLFCECAPVTDGVQQGTFTLPIESSAITKIRGRIFVHTGTTWVRTALICQEMRMLGSVRTVGHLGGQKARKTRTTAAITIPRGHRRATLVMRVWGQSLSPGPGC